MTAVLAGPEPAACAASRRCGSYAGWNACKRAGADPCRACKDARNAYVRRWRGTLSGIEQVPAGRTP